jgi:ribosomal protein S18 acetylase RimI-like enzyme
MTSAQFDVWSRRSADGFVAQQVAAGLQPEPEARAFAEQQLEDLLPEGAATPTHHLWQVVAQNDVVGALWLRVRALPAEVEGYVFDIEIEARARGRGFGRATMLAAEVAARDLGADVIRLNVFADNTAAVRLYESLGYTATAVSLTKWLTGDPSGVTAGSFLALRDMAGDEYVAWRPHLLSRFGAEELAWLLPHGRLSPGHLLWTAHADGESVGFVWLHVRLRSDGQHAFGYHLEVAEHLRCQGYGRAVLAAAESRCRTLGVRSVRLTLSSPSDLATRLFYVKAGFEVTALSMAKGL